MTTNNHDESQLVEAYLEQLRRDPDADSPDQLDPGYAEFLRTLVRSNRVPVSTTMQSRAWQRVIAQPAPTNTNRRPLLLAAVALILVIFGVTLANIRFNLKDSSQGAAALAASETTVPTGTPIEATPTIIPASDSTVDATATTIPSAVQSTNKLNSMFSGELTDTVRSIDYTFAIPQTGLLYAMVESPDFSANMAFTYSAPDNNGGSGGGGGSGDYVARAEIFAPVEASSRATITVTSMDGQGKGKFSLGVYHTVPERLTIGTSIEPFSVGLAGDARATITKDSPFKAFTVVATAGAGTQLSVRISTSGNKVQTPDRVGLPTVDLAMSLLETPSNGGGNALLEPFGGLGQTCDIEPIGGTPQFCTDLDSGEGPDPEFVNVTFWHDAAYTIILRPQDWSAIDGVFTLWGLQTLPASLKSGESQSIHLTTLSSVKVFKVTAKHDIASLFDLALVDGLTPVTVKFVQRGQLLQTTKLTDHQPLTASVQPLFDDNMLIFVKYANEGGPYMYHPPTTITLTQR